MAPPRSPGVGRSFRSSSCSSDCACPSWCRPIPTSGGIYWWAAKLGGPKAGFYTGWLNLIGLIAILASVAYGCATFLDLTLGTFSETWLNGYSLTRTFLMFVVILVVVAAINIFSSHLLAVINNISVWWHVAGAAIVIAHPVAPARAARELRRRCSPRPSTTAACSAARRPAGGFLLFVLPIVGDPHAVHDHWLRRVGAPIRGDQERGQRGGQGHLAVDLLLGHRRLDTAAVIPLRRAGRRRGIRGRRRRRCDLQPGDELEVGGIVLFISTAGQLFCTTACQTSASRMLFAFSRDRAVPGHQLWSALSAKKVPANG